MLTLSDVLYRLYEAALSPTQWPPALRKLAEFSGSRGSLVYAKKAAGHWVVVTHSPDLDEAVAAYDRENWWEHNPWLNTLGAFEFQAGDVYCDQDILGDDQIRTNPFYADFLARFGLAWQMVAIIQSDLGAPTALVAGRGNDAGAYLQAEKDKFLVVSRHLEQSLRISVQMDKVQSDHETVAHAFDALERPAIVLDRERRPVLVNRSARALIGDYFLSGPGPLQPTQAHEEEPFAAAVRNAHDSMDDHASAPGPMTISHARGGQRLVVWALPLVGASAGHLGIDRPDGHVLLTAQPLEQDRMIEPTAIRSVFGLTLGEARLASRLGAGQTLTQAAKALDITEGTARVVLKRAFQKLGVGRQAQLVTKLTALLK